MRLPLAIPVVLCASAISVAADTPAERRVKAAFAAQEKEGFKVRDDFWKGALGLKKKKSVKHQLYRGNEYWFWLGAADASARAFLKVYDSKGRPVDVETAKGKGWSAVRVLPPKTETYTIVLVFEKDGAGKKEEVAWAMTYGYR